MMYTWKIYEVWSWGEHGEPSQDLFFGIYKTTGTLDGEKLLAFIISESGISGWWGDPEFEFHNEEKYVSIMIDGKIGYYAVREKEETV